VELPGITEPDRVRNLLQGSANLEFWKTYNVNELGMFFNELNARSSEYAMAKRSATSETAEVETSQQDSLTAQLLDVADASTTVLTEDESEILITKSFIEYFNEPYFAMSGVSGPIVGSVSKLDTAAVNFLLDKYKDVFPSDVKFKWGFKAIDQRETYFQLYALKGDGRGW
jgi:SecD/SecF fusion protein